MVNEADIVCGEASDRAATGPIHHLRLSGAQRNVTLEVRDITRAMVTGLPDVYLDLLELATYVYCADQMITRGGAGVDNMGENWRRKLTFHIPVREVALWTADSMREALTNTLGFLSDDDYSFHFVPMRNPAPAQAYLKAGEEGDCLRIQEVALFSGGLDSLGGAIEESVIAGKRVAFVTHQSTKKLASRQRRLVQGLAARSKSAPLFVPVEINKAKNLGREPSQRSRSFLYASLAAAVAGSLGLFRIRFYENGIVSLNLPPLAQIVGAKATRTTHPRVLRGFERILGLVAGHRFEVESPFLWHTRTDVLEQIVRAGCGPLVADTVSCMHTWEMSNRHPHCGSCSQCIGRRLAVLAAGAEQFDPDTAYKVPLLDGARDDNESRTMVAALASSAEEFTKMSAQEFFARFGEAARVLRFVGETADAAALKVHELHRRHGQQISGALDKAIAANARRIREGELPATCLLRLIVDSSTGAPRTSREVPADHAGRKPGDATATYFNRAGRGWKVCYQGGPEFFLPRMVGCEYLHILLSQSGCPMPVAQLVAAQAKVPVELLRGTPSERLDEEAVANYKQVAKDLAAEVADARRRRDATQEAVASNRLSAVAAILERDGAFRGRRRMHSDESERARKAVHRALERVLRVIKEEDKECWQHLSKALRRGWNPCYDPDPPVTWATSS